LGIAGANLTKKASTSIY